MEGDGLALFVQSAQQGKAGGFSLFGDGVDEACPGDVAVRYAWWEGGEFGQREVQVGVLDVVGRVRYPLVGFLCWG